MKASQQKNNPLFFGLILTLLAIAASGCVLPVPRSATAAGPRDAAFLPPTLVPTPLPTSAAAALQQSTPQQVNCVDSLTFTKDITIPDGTIIAPASSIDKRWEVENSGTCNWNSKYHLKLVAGPEMGVKPEQRLLPARSGSRNVIRLVFTAPSQTGTYRSAWQAFNADGQPFGDTVYIEVVVQQTALTPTP